jgi:hypothetical protein
MPEASAPGFFVVAYLVDRSVTATHLRFLCAHRPITRSLTLPAFAFDFL